MKPQRKGRSESRLACRDEKMALRFYFHAEIRNCTYSQAIRNLSDEFDIDESVVTERLRKINLLVDKVFTEKPSVRLLRERIPYYSW